MTRTAAAISLSLAVTLLPACDRADETTPAEARAPLPVTTVRVETTDVAARLEAGGVVAAAESAIVSSRIVAPVMTVRVKAGDRVRAGDVLLTLDARDVADRARSARAMAAAAERAVNQARAEQGAVQAEHRLATTWHSRITALHARNSATAQERDEADARLASAAARMAGAQAGIELADANVTAARAAAAEAATTESFATMRAPFDGLVTERLVDPGSLASPGTPLLRVDAAGARHVIVSVDEARAAYIEVGDPAEILLEHPDALAGDAPAVRGKVIEVARAVATDQRAFSVEVELPSSLKPRSGTFARVRFAGPSRRALLIPPGAVQRQGQVASVFVVREGVARLRLVQVGSAGDRGVEVLAGLDSGDVVIAPVPPGLTDGQSVKAAARSVEPGARP